MVSYVDVKIWGNLCPYPSWVLWLVNEVFRIDNPQGYPLDLLLYEALHKIEPVDNRYVNAFNSARIELVTTHVEPPAGQLGERLWFEYTPRGEPAYWLLSCIFGFTDEEIATLAGTIEPTVVSPEVLRLLRRVYRSCKRRLAIEDPLIAQYQKSRYFMLRYYADAVYHLI